MLRHLLILLSIVSFSQLIAQPDLVFESWKTGFDDPVDIANAGDGTNRLFIVEQDGIIKIIENDVVLATPFMDIDPRVLSGGERGLLGLAFHPDYENNGYFYVNYIDNGGDTRISRFEVDPNNANLGDPDSEVILLEIEQPYGNHNAGDLAFGQNDGYLYIALGDGGSAGDPGDRSQDSGCLLGKMLRIDVDGGGGAASPSQSGGDCDFTSSANYTVPASNPFVGDPNTLDEIWSEGLRNPWRFSFDSANGDMWIADVGQGLWEEVDYEKSGSGGANYGWRCYEGDHDYNTSGCGPAGSYTGPVFEYGHVDGWSITGGFVYRGSNFPGMVGYYIMADYGSDNVWALFRDQNGDVTSTMYTNIAGINSISTFGEDENGELYAASLSGTIYKVEDNTPLPAELTSFTGFAKDGSNELSWSVASIIYVAHFDIEKSIDGISFTSIGKVAARENTAPSDYEYTDPQPAYGINYYRLKVVDSDGYFEYSKIIDILNQKPIDITISPNPNDGKFGIACNEKINGLTVLKIYNAAGEVVLMEEIEVGKDFTKSFDLSDQPKGIYLVQLNSGQILETRKLVIR